jgi:hypothetical protein
MEAKMSNEELELISHEFACMLTELQRINSQLGEVVTLLNAQEARFTSQWKAYNA